MAYAALLSLAQTIDKLLHPHNDQYSLSLPERQQIISTNESITFLKAFLEDFPGEANSLEGRIRDVASETEDIIESFMLKQFLLHYISKSTAGPESAKFSQFLKSKFMWLQGKRGGIYTRLMLHFNFKKLKKVVREAMLIKNSTTTKDAQLSNAYSSVATSSSRLIAPTSKDDAMVGLDDDLMAIKTRLCGESSKLQVIPIFGMGGIGKTTLARNTYDDPLTAEHFDIRAWVTVLQDYNTQEILSTLLISMKAEGSRETIDRMREIVYKRLKGRRYLIVMDDIWSTKAWDDVKMIFPDDCNGSRIILTTRLHDVAAYPDSSSPLHEMHFIDVDQSWKLLQQTVFAGENLCPPELQTIGMTIARSCRGLPLAIIVIAGLLSTVDKTQESWRNIATNVNIAINNTNEELFAKILSLSYIHLPHYLRLCFLFMGGFKEDHEICVSKLIKLWVAEGFSKPSESISCEEVAEEYVEDLVKRSLVLVSRRKTNGKIKTCSVHDLVRDLCIRKAQEEKFLLNVTGRYAYKNPLIKSTKIPRHISIAFSHLNRLKNICRSTIRTIICFNLDESSLSSFGKFRLLRVLDVVSSTNDYEWFIVSDIPAQVFELFHLRYLSFTSGVEFVIPPSILNLQNLQTLIIQQAIGYLQVHLPLEIWRMPQLRHLIFIGPLPTIPQGAPTSALENLQTLSKVENFTCTKEILKMIPNLKTLGIIYRTEKYVQDIHLDNLVLLHQLEKLKLAVYLGPFQGQLSPVFPITLRKLTLVGWGLPWKDMDIVGSLPNLQVLKLRRYACYGDKWETSEGEFSQLKFLLIEDSRLQHWITESSHFPSLRCLVLYHCWNLSEIPDGIGEIPTLELIEVDGRNKSLVDSMKRVQEEQESWGNDALQVRVGDTWRK